MRVYVDIVDEKTKANIFHAIGMCCGVAVADEKDADLYVGEKAHPFLDSVIVTNHIPDDLDQVVDVILPGQELDYYLMKFKLMYCYVLTRCSIETFLDEEIYKSQRYNIPLSIAMVKVCSDEEFTTRALYNNAKKQARTSDRIVLYDKNTLIAILPYAGLDGAKVFVGRLIRRAKRIKLPKTSHFPDVIASICQITNEITDASDLLLRLEETAKDAVLAGQRIVTI